MEKTWRWFGPHAQKHKGREAGNEYGTLVDQRISPGHSVVSV
ncbi:MAG: hypothetical protein ACI3ZQ_09280 [Candidatus Cryptobacteroides sp.]